MAHVKRKYSGPTPFKRCRVPVKLAGSEVVSGGTLFVPCDKRVFRHTLCLDHYKADKIRKARNLLSVTVNNKEKPNAAKSA